jgi:hypothetical protein
MLWQEGFHQLWLGRDLAQTVHLDSQAIADGLMFFFN